MPTKRALSSLFESYQNIFLEFIMNQTSTSYCDGFSANLPHNVDRSMRDKRPLLPFTVAFVVTSLARATECQLG